MDKKLRSSELKVGDILVHPDFDDRTMTVEAINEDHRNMGKLRVEFSNDGGGWSFTPNRLNDDPMWQRWEPPRPDTKRIVYQFENPDWGWVTYSTLDDLMEEIRNEIEANNLFPCDLDFAVKVVAMSQAELDALPITDDL